MHLVSRPSGFKETTAVIVKVTLWEVFLLYNRHDLYNKLSTYALDNGPLDRDAVDRSTVTFRFSQFDWNNTLRAVLEQHNIPVMNVVHMLGN